MVPAVPSVNAVVAELPNVAVLVGTLFGTGGPFYVIYLNLRGLDRSVFRATFAMNFLIDGGVRLAQIGGGATRYTSLESGSIHATMLVPPLNKVAREKGFNELLFLGDMVEFAQAGFGATEKRIKENHDEVYRMVRAQLRSVMFLLDKRHQNEIVEMIMKRWKLSDRKMAESIFRDVVRVVAKDAAVTQASIQSLIDSACESAKVTRPVRIEEVADFSFVDRARKELGLTR